MLKPGDMLPNGVTYQKPEGSGEGWFGYQTIYGKDGEHDAPYLTRFRIGRLCLHIFWRGDNDPDCHDHPWGFWTFPLHAYVEEVVTSHMNPVTRKKRVFAGYDIEGRPEYLDMEYFGGEPVYERRQQVVPARRWSYRPATHTHRVLGRVKTCMDKQGRPKAEATLRIGGERAEAYGFSGLGPFYKRVPGKIVTIVWRDGGPKRPWGFLKDRDGRWCWVPWKDYVYGGGKSAPCE
jgi:hypothetical protein